MTNKISPFIGEQFPAFYKEDNEFFIEFVKGYYKWLEETGNPLYHSRRLPEYFDIDTTPEEFIIHFKEKYLPDFALLNETDKRTLVKYALDIYRSKGSIRSLKLLFKLVYNDEIDVYWPGDDIFKPSDAHFRIPRYLEVSVAPKTQTFVGKQIQGESSGARGIVESVSRRTIQSAIVDVIQMTNVRGSFEYDELISIDGVLEGCPRVVGSMTTLSVVNGGRDFTDGQILDVVSDSIGFNGRAKVKATTTQSGQVSYTLIDGGAGYRATNNIYISERVLGYDNLRPWASGSTEGFSLFEVVEQPLVNVSFISATDVIVPGSYVYGVNSSAGIVAGGVVVNTSQTNTSYAAGSLVISDRRIQHIGIDSIVDPDIVTSSFHIGAVVYQKLSLSDTSNNAVGRVFGANSSIVLMDTYYGKFQVGLPLYSATTTANAASVATYGSDQIQITVAANTDFNIGDQIFQRRDGITNTAVGTITRISSNTIIVSTDSIDGVFDSTTNVYSSNTSPGNQSVISVRKSYTDRISDSNIVEYWAPNANNAATLLNESTASISAAPVDVTPTAEYIGSNTTYIGLYNISTTASFVPSVYAPVVGRTSNVFANAVAISTAAANPGSFEITSLVDTESVVLYTDFISDSNSSNTPYVDVKLDATAYGFPASPSANSTSAAIDQILTRTIEDIGTIASIGNIDVGSFNSNPPIVLIYDKLISGFGRKNFQLELTNRNSFPFIPGESVSIEFTQQLTNVEFTTITGNTQFDESGAGESVYQVHSDGTWIYGTVRGQTLASPTNVITLERVYALTSQYGSPTTGTFDASNNIVGILSGAVANTITSVTQIADQSATQGTVLTSNSTTVSIKRTRLAKQEYNLLTIEGDLSGANGTVVAYNDIVNSNPLGASAVVETDAGTGVGVVTQVDVVSSGFGYAPGETLTLISNGNPYSITAVAGVNGYGFSEGYWDTTDSFVSDTKKIQDSEYYQEFSYEIQSSLSKETYERKVLDLAHVSGTKMFGAVVSSQTANAVVNAAEATTTFDVAVEDVSNFNVGDVVVDVASGTTGTVDAVVERTIDTFNGYSNVINGAVAIFNSNTDVTPGVKASFDANGSVVEGHSIQFNANLNVTSAVNFTFNGSSNVVNIVTNTFNSSSNVYPGVYIENVGGISAISAPVITFASNAVNSSQAVSFNANTSVANSDNTPFNANLDVNSAKISFTSTTSVTPAYNFVFNAASSTTKTETRQVVSHYESVIDRYEQVISKYNTVVDKYITVPVGTRQVVDRNETYISGYTQVYDHTEQQITGYRYEERGGKWNSYTVQIPVYADVVIYRNDPVYATRPVYRTETVYGQQAVYRQDPVYVQQPVYRQEARYRTESYQVPSPESVDYIPLTNANTYIQVGDLVKYNAGEDYYKVGVPVGGLVDGKIYTVLTSNTTAIKLRDHTISGSANALPLVWSKVYGTSAINHRFTLTTGASITGANSFISIPNANSYFLAGDVITYSTDTNTQLLARIDQSTITTFANNSNLYVQFANTSGIALAANVGGPRIALPASTTATQHYFTGYAGLSGTIASANASLFVAGDSVYYRVDSGNSALTYLQPLNNYYIQFANATHLALSRTSGGVRIPLVKGLTQTGHTLVSTKAGSGAIAITNANTYFDVGDSVVYTVSTGNTALVGLTSGSEYYIQTSNATHIGLSATRLGPRIQLNQGATEGGHTLTGTNLIRASANVSIGDYVQYVAATGNTAITGLVNTSLYQVSFVNTTSFKVTTVNQINTISVANAGLGYTNDDIITVTDGNPTIPASFRLVTNSSGAITSVSFYTRGAGYSRTPRIVLSGLQGTGGVLTAANTINNANVSLAKIAYSTGHSFIPAGRNRNVIAVNGTGLQSNDKILYYTTNNTPSIPGLTNNTSYYIDYVSAIAIGLKSTTTSARLPISSTYVNGSIDVTRSGHNFILADANNTIKIGMASVLVAGDELLYRVSPGNTAITPLENNTKYFVDFANSTHIGLSRTLGGTRLALVKGKIQSGHRFYKMTGNSGLIRNAAAINLNAGDIVRYTANVSSTPIGQLTSNSFYYVQFANNTHLALSERLGGDRALITAGSSDTGHRLKAYGIKSTIATPVAKHVTVGDAVKYVTYSGNTPLTGLSNTQSLFIQFANATHIALANTATGDRIDITKGASETGHWISPRDTKGTIVVSNEFTTNDATTYTVTSNNTPLIGFVANNTYYIEHANATHLAVTEFVGGPRLSIMKGLTQTGHTFSSAGANGTIYSTDAADFAINDPVLYVTAAGQTPVPGLVNNGNYFVQYQTTDRIALSSTIGGYRIPITKGSTANNHKIIKIGLNSLIESSIAANLDVNEPVIYTSSNLSANLATKGPSGYLSSGTTYYVQFANATHVAISSTPGGERITLDRQVANGTSHTISDAVINTVTISTTSTQSNVRFTPAGTINNITTSASGTIVNVNVNT